MAGRLRAAISTALFVFLTVAVAPCAAATLTVPSPDGEYIATSSNDRVLWLVPTNKAGRKIKIGDEPVGGAAPRWAPDSRRLAFYSMSSGSLQLWLFDVRTGSSRELTHLPRGIAPLITSRLWGIISDAARFSWSPDGSKIAFASLVDEASGEQARPRNVFPSESDIKADVPIVLNSETPADWALNGVVSYKSLFEPWATSSAPGSAVDAYSQILIADVSDGSTSVLTHDHRGYFMPEWSPDGRIVAFASANGGLFQVGAINTDIFALELSTGAIHKLTSIPGLKVLPTWSPDGRYIAFNFRNGSGASAFARGRGGLGIVCAGAGACSERLLPQAEPNAFAWSPRGDGLIYTFRDGLETHMAEMDLDGQSRSLMIRRQVTVTMFGNTFGTSRAGISWIQQEGVEGAETLWFWKRGGQPKSVTPISKAAGSARRIEVEYWNNSNGVPLSGILIFPEEYDENKKYPVVVDAYGNVTVEAAKFLTSVNYVKAAKDYFVFAPNHRAPHMWMNSVTADPVYDAAAVGPTGIKVTVDDIASGLQKLSSLPQVDISRSCIAGFSNGGMEASQIIAETKMFKCAYIEAPAPLDWLSYGFINNLAEVKDALYNTLPWEDPQIYVALTPLFKADRIETPVLLAVGDRDAAVIGTIELYNTLRYLGKDVVALRYPNEQHGFVGKAAEDSTVRIAAFFRKYLQ